VQFIEVEAEKIATENLDYPAILAGHIHIFDAAISEHSEKIISMRDPTFHTAEVGKKEFSYVALGHIHKHQDLNYGKTPPVVYCGSIERITFSEEEQTKGFVLVEIDTDKTATYTHIPTAARAFVTINADIRFSEDPMRKIRAEMEKKDVTDAIVRVMIECNAAQQKDVNEKEIRDALATCFKLDTIRYETEEQKIFRNATTIERFDTTEKALEKYILARPDLEPMREKLLAAARDLENDVDEA
jgi:DNA repair protein SbcD/Mre11